MKKVVFALEARWVVARGDQREPLVAWHPKFLRPVGARGTRCNGDTPCAPTGRERLPIPYPGFPSVTPGYFPPRLWRERKMTVWDFLSRSPRRSNLPNDLTLRTHGGESLVVALRKLGVTLPPERPPDGAFAIGRLEIARLDNDPNFPDRGQIDFDMRGGR